MVSFLYSRCSVYSLIRSGSALFISASHFCVKVNWKIAFGRQRRADCRNDVSKTLGSNLFFHKDQIFICLKTVFFIKMFGRISTQGHELNILNVSFAEPPLKFPVNFRADTVSSAGISYTEFFYLKQTK